MTDRASQTRAALAGIMSRNGCAWLAFSGGKESIALARLCEPYADRVRLLLANTGFNFPHMEALIRSYGERFEIVELRSDLLANWRANGMSSDVVPIANAMPPGFHVEPRLQAWPACCFALRTKPILDFLSATVEPAALIHGQRRQDRTPGLGLSGLPMPEHIEVTALLADWTDEEVFAFLEAEGVPLPAHYGEVRDSLDCWVCPSAFGDAKGPARAAYMAKAHPELLARILPAMRRTRDAVTASLGRLDASLASAAGGDDDFRPILQWAPDEGDCVAAALATVLRRSYAETAAILGFSCDPASGRPIGIRGKGVGILDIASRLLPLGIMATIVLSDAFPDAPSATLPLPALRDCLRGRPAIVTVRDRQDGRDENHALACMGRRLVDCRGPEARSMRLDDVEILGAAILTIQQPEREAA